jgi:hypothetical protein
MATELVAFFVLKEPVNIPKNADTKIHILRMTTEV